VKLHPAVSPDLKELRGLKGIPDLKVHQDLKDLKGLSDLKVHQDQLL
jgi:hypothetical protein